MQSVILVSFGSSNLDTYNLLAMAIKERFPTVEVRQAFTSSFMIRRLASRGILIDTLPDAIAKLRDEGFTRIILLPTHLTPGEEFDNKIKPCAAEDVEIIAPLLSDSKVLPTIIDCFKPNADEDLILVGHGSPHRHNPIYEQLQRLTGDKIHIGVIEETDTPNFADVVERLKKSRAEKVLLAPLLFNAGMHVDKDIAGGWFDKLNALSYKVRVVREGLGNFESFRELYIKKLEEMSIF